MKSKDPFSQDPNEEFLLWLLEQRAFALAYLWRNYSSLSREDGEDIFSEVCEKQVKLGSDHFQLLEVGVLVQRLNWTARDFLARRNAFRRGGKAEHVSSDDLDQWLLASDADPLAPVIQLDDLCLLLTLTEKVESQCNPRQLMLVRKVREVVGSGQSVAHWSKAFSDEEKAEFMKMSSGDPDLDEAKFRREVNRACRQVIEKLRSLYRTSDGHWPN